MQIVRFSEPVAFYHRAEPFLLTHEAEHNLILGVAGNLLRNTGEYPHPHYMAVVESAGRIAAVALRTPPFNLLVSLVDPQDEDALCMIAEDAAKLDDLPSGVSGEIGSTAKFVRCWQAASGQRAVLKMPQRIYKLEQVQMPQDVAGEYHPAVSADRDLLASWYSAFFQEALNDQPTQERMTQAIDAYLRGDGRGLRVWWDRGLPVSMAAYMGFTQNGVRIGAVYTPPEHRKHGYASACVAWLSQEMLDQGRTFCFLFTDLMNPTSNAIYQQIGYQPVCDVSDYRFVRDDERG